MAIRLVYGFAIFTSLGIPGCARRADEARSAAAVQTVAARVYRDPRTGAFGEPPPGAVPAAPAAARPALAEEAAPGGGRLIRLHGAFRSEFAAHSDGKATTVQCAGH